MAVLTCKKLPDGLFRNGKDIADAGDPTSMIFRATSSHSGSLRSTRLSLRRGVESQLVDVALLR
ncbi:hypothetical protein XI03_21105 [Bradyrhizobium sp. CCBAU 65884]|nr:hypothetical protein [Bradyrhizobium sp. CCBAU 65884]